jgi:GT2 family glycosyltransferase
VKDPKGEVYVIVVSWNNEKILPECFDSVKDQTYKNHRTILVDNDSHDQTLQMVKKDYPWVKLLPQSSNLGFAQGNNVGMKKALEDPDCRYIVLLNSDARLGKNWIEHLVEFADKHPDGACFQGLTLDYYDHDTVDSRWTIINRNGSGIQVGYREPRKDQKIHEATVFGVNAAAALYSRKFLDEQPFGSHYFDDDLFMYLEDVDLCARAIVMGWNNYFTDKVLAYHMGSASSSKRPWFSTYFIYRNNALILYKNMPFKLLRRMVKGAIKTDLGTIKHHIKRHEYRVARAIVRGRIASIFLLPSYTKKRRIMKSVAKREAENIWNLM